jgi:four helix bundle protein
MQTFKNLLAWQSCHKLVLAVYRITANWPPEERYGLVAQARRAAYSAAANIAEGSAKRGAREFRRFLDVSLGSLAELCYVILLARDLGLLAGDIAAAVEAQRDEAGRITWGLYAKVSKRS